MSLKDRIKWLIRGWLPSREHNVKVHLLNLAPAFLVSILLISLATVASLQFLFPPPNSNSSASKGITELWSMKLSEYPSPFSDLSATIPVPDVNGDDINDIVAGAGDNNIYCLSGADGSILWEQNLGRSVRNVWAVPSQGEDGVNIVASTANNDGNHNGETYLLSGIDGEKIWEFSKGSAILLVPDINDDDIPEVLIENKGKESYYESENQYYVSEYESISLISGVNGKELWTSSIGNNCSGIWGSRCVDFIENQNSSVISCWYNPPYDINRPYIFSYNPRNGEKMWSCQVFRPVSIVVASITGKADVIIGAVNGSYLINGEDGEVVWTRNLGTETVLEVTVMQDINSDGTNDVLAGSVDTSSANAFSKVRLLSGADGTTLWEHNLRGSVSFGELATIEDLNKDGVFEVVVVEYFMGRNYVYILNGVDGEVLGEYTLQDSGSIKELVVIPDINGDKSQDIIITSNSDTNRNEDQYYRIFLLAPDPSEFQEQGSG